MTKGEGRDKDKAKRLERLEKRVVLHLRLASEAQNTGACIENLQAVITAQHEIIGILAGIVKMYNDVAEAGAARARQNLLDAVEKSDRIDREDMDDEAAQDRVLSGPDQGDNHL